jgi:hypothetical protein
MEIPGTPINMALLDYLAGEANAIELSVILSRERAPNGASLIRVYHGDRLIHMLWEPTKSDKITREGTMAATPRHTGGKKSYVMVMLRELERVFKGKGSDQLEIIGFLVRFFGYIEWGTGRLINKRAKKPLRYADLMRISGCGRTRLNRILSKLKEQGLLAHTGEGYFVSDRLIRKGRSKNSDRS